MAATPTLYLLPGSHPCAAVQVAFDLKGVARREVDLLPFAQLVVGPLRYGGVTAPGMRINGRRVLGSRAIMRALDELSPDPPLLPPVGDEMRDRVLEAEQWGDEVFQVAPRRLLDAGFVRAPSSAEGYAGDAYPYLPRPLLRPMLPAIARLLALRNRATDVTARADLEALPAQLDRIDADIAAGVLGAEEPNAADLQIGASLRLLLSIADLRPLIEGRPAARLVRFFQPHPGEIPAGVLPREWLDAVSGPSSAA